MNGKILSLYLLSICFISISHTQEKFPPAEDIVDDKYYEGYRNYTNVSAGQVKLISCLAQYTQKTPADSSFFNFGFYVPVDLEDKDIDIFIEDRKQKSYYMMPIQKKWSKGFQTFNWEGRKAKAKHIGLDNLFGVATLKRDSDLAQTIVPITFFDSQQPAEIESYEFVFVATRRANLRCTIFDESEHEVLRPVSFQNQPKNKNVIFKWDCSNVGSGKYILQLEYVLTNGQRVKSQNIYQFYHRNKLVE
jgi:hypothetical protein